MAKIFLICSVRNASKETVISQDAYVAWLECHGNSVHYPPRDTKQDNTGLAICTDNASAIRDSDEVHVFYNQNSQGIHFDLGVAFALHKRVVFANPEQFDIGPSTGKSFPKMIREWEGSGR